MSKTSFLGMYKGGWIKHNRHFPYSQRSSSKRKKPCARNKNIQAGTNLIIFLGIFSERYVPENHQFLCPMQIAELLPFPEYLYNRLSEAGHDYTQDYFQRHFKVNAQQR